MSASDILLSAEDLRVALGNVLVLDIPSLRLNDKEVLTVVGPNGSGKSTLLLTLACLLKPVSGSISYRGKPLDSHEAIFRFRRKIAMVFQEPLLFDTSVYNNVAAGLKFRGLSKNRIRERVEKYLNLFSIGHLAERSARKLSGGESQRASLARAFAIEPEIILLDEPFSALDPPTRHGVIHDLDKVVQATGTTTVMVTHVEFEALTLSRRIAVMNLGRIAQLGSPSDVMQNPVNEFVAKLVGMEVILSGTVLRSAEGQQAISVAGKEIRAYGNGQPGEAVLCCIRPENIRVGTQEMNDPEGSQNILAGKITHIYSMGPFARLSLDCGIPLVSLVTRESFSKMNLEEGQEICAFFPPASVHLIPAGSDSH